MSNPLNIKTIKISDELSQLATNCTLELVSDPSEQNVVGEFALPGDVNTPTATDLRPNGAQIPVIVPFDGVPEQIFVGNVEFTDDLSDPNTYSYQIDLSNLPVGYPERNQISTIFNQVTPLNGWTDVSSYSIIIDVCAQAGLQVGRIDLPPYNVWGNFEVIRKTPIQVCEELCRPFNAFQFLQYKVRCDKNGLSIIRIDYTLGGEVSNLYPLQNLISSKRTFSMYQPENKIGSSDVLLTGGDIYGAIGNTSSGSCTKSFFQTTQNDGMNTDTTSWTETTTNVLYNITLTGLPPAAAQNQYGVGNVTQNLPPTVQPTLDANIALLKAGTIKDLKINQSFISTQTVNDYTLNGECLEQTVTTSTFADIVFNGGVPGDGTLSGGTANNTVFDFGVPDSTINTLGGNCVAQVAEFTTPKHVKTAEVTSTTLIYQGYQIPSEQTNKYYHYTSLGICDYTVVQEYAFVQGQWGLISQTVEPGDIQEFTNATIAFYNQIDTKVNLPLNGQTKTNIGKYQLRNGEQVLPVRLQSEPCLLTEEGAVLKNYAINNAFQVDCPHMDYSGLAEVQFLASLELALEQAGAYWEEVEVSAIIDTVPVIGESVLLNGSGGILDRLEHTITSDSAVSTFHIRRLITTANG